VTLNCDSLYEAAMARVFNANNNQRPLRQDVAEEGENEEGILGA